MKKTLFLFGLLIIPFSLSAAPVFERVVYRYNTGPLPPEHYYEIALNIVLDNGQKLLDADYNLAGGAGGRLKESLKGRLSRERYEELTRLLSEIGVCKGRGKDRLLGAPERSVTIYGSGLDGLVRSGEKNPDELVLRPLNTCEKQMGWWNRWKHFSKAVVRELMAGKRSVR